MIASKGVVHCSGAELAPIRVGIVGAGENTRLRHIPGLKAEPGVDIVAVCNRTEASARRVADAFDIPRVFDSWEALVAAPDIDAIVIGTWPYLHAPVTLAALAAGRHVLCEARMAMNLAEARAMLEASQRHPQLVAHLVPAPFTLPVDRTLRRLVDDGYLGRLLHVEIQAPGGPFMNAESPLTWRQNVALSGINVLTLGIWYESMLRWVGAATRVMARAKIFTRERRDPETGRMVTIQVPDHLDVLADLEGGAQARLVVSGVMGLAGGPFVALYGSEGTLRYGDGRLVGGRKGEAELREIPIPDTERGAWRVEAEFIGAIRGREPVRLTRFEDGVRYMAFTEAVSFSLAREAAVDVWR